jgi:hypothetical protein
MTLSKFTLVHSADGLGLANRRVLEATQPSGQSRLLRLPRLLSPQNWFGYADPAGEPVSGGEQESPLRVTVALWDLGAWLGNLLHLIEALNRIQNDFVFYEVKATVTAGMISRPERVVSWATEAMGEPLKAEEEREIQDNVIADDFFPPAESIRRDLKVDYLVGITPSMVAGKESDGIYWNHFSTFEGHTALVSTFDLREFAEETGRSLEVFLAKIIISQMLVAMFWPELSFHANRGCLFDYDESRITIVDKIRSPQIEPDCMNRIDARYHPALLAFLEFIRTYFGE